MPLTFADRVRDTTTTTGTGTVTLSGTAPTGYQNFSVIGNGNTTYYTINAGSQWEVGIGTYSSTGPTLSRDTVLESSNANALVDFAAGVKDVFVTYPSDKVIIQDASGNVGIGTTTVGERLVVQGAGKFTTNATNFNAGQEGALIDFVPGTFVRMGHVNGASGAAKPVVFISGGNEVGRFDASANFTANTSLRSPIFYDSDNTSFYLDLTGSTSLNAAGSLIASGNITLNNGANRRVRIGSATNYFYDLQSTNDDFQIIEAGTTPRLTIKYPNGDVGINTTAPQARLEANLVAAAQSSLMNAGSVNDVGILRAPFSANPEAASNSGAKWGLRFVGRNDGIYDTQKSAAIYAVSEDPGAGYNRAVGLAFQVSSFDAANTERMRITAAGNLGLGTSAPTVQFQINGTQPQIQWSNPTTGVTSDDGTHLYLSGSDFWLVNKEAAAMVFATSNTERMRINSSGNVTANVDIRAPIYYDSNNTAFYLDPAGTSVLNGIGAGTVSATNFTASNAFYVNGFAYYLNSTNGGWYANARIQSETDMRAPIFYDFNNTGFYVDPAAAGISANFAGSVNATTNNLAGLRVNASSTASSGGAIAIQQATVEGWTGIFCDYEPFTGYGIWADNNSDIISFTGETSTGGIRSFSVPSRSSGLRTAFEKFRVEQNTGDTTTGRDGYANSSFRAPIFYDSNNTSYYLDPASGSVLFDLNISGSGNKYLQINSTSGNEAMVRYIGATGSSWYVGKRTSAQLVGTADFHFFAENPGATVAGIDTAGNIFASGSVRAPIFYDSNNTAFYLDPAGTSNTNAANGMWMVGTTNAADTINGSTWYGVGRNNIGSGQVQLAGFYGILLRTSGAIMNVEGDYAQINGSFRAPIFYDSDNTAYFFNGAGVSSVFGLAIRGDAASTGTTNQLFLWDSGGSTTSAIGFKANGGQFANPTGNGDGFNTYLTMDTVGRGWVFRRGTGGSDFTSAFTSGWILNNGIWQSNGDMRAPIFYDSNNTGFYLDPASTSITNIVRANTIQFSNGNVANDLANATYNILCDPSARIAMYLGNGDPNNYYDNNGHIFRNRATATLAQINGSGVFAPIYYDSQDSSYYVDPNGTSILNNSRANRFVNRQDVSTDSAFGLFFANTESTAYAIYREAGAWDFPFPDLRIAFHTGIKLGANASYQGIRFYTDFDMSTQVMSVNNANDPLGGSNVFVNNSLQAGSSLRAPIFFDSQNTAYYCDPNSDSILFKFQNINQRVAYDRAWDNFPSITVYNTTDQGPQGDFRIHGIGGSSGGDFAVRLLVDGTIESLSDVRGPIFYDSNNTGYYVDPTGGTSLRTVGDWRSDSAGWTGEFNGKIQYHANNWYFQAASSWEFRRSDTANAFFVNQSGECTARGDYRAPIYYDSNNTFYYLNLDGYSQVNGNGSVNGSSGVGLNIMSVSGNGAIMAFHRSGLFAVNMGLDSDNVIRIGGWSAGANRLQMDMSGNLTMAGNVTAFSDVRLKKDIETIDGALDLVSRMRGVRFTRIENDERNVGVVAQEMLEVLPEVVQQGVGDDDTLSVAYGNLVGVLIEAIKELRAEVAELKGK